MLTMKAQMDVICCKSVGTDLSMLDIEDFISEICQLKKEVASLEAKLRERGDKPNREDLEKVSVCVTDGTKAQDSELSLTLLCYTDDNGPADQTSDCNAGEQQMPLKMCSIKLVDCRNLIENRRDEQQHSHEEEDDWIDDNDNDGNDGTEAQDHGSADQTSDCNAGEQQIQETPLKICFIKLEDCRNLIESRGDETTADEQQQSHEEEDDEDDDQDEDEDQIEDDDVLISDDNAGSSSDGETASTSKKRRTVTDCGKRQRKRQRKCTEQKDFTCKICDISFPTSEEMRLHSKEHRMKKEFRCGPCGKDFNSSASLFRHKKTHRSVKPFQCSECNKYLRTKRHLASHMRYHGEKKLHQCPQCEKSFTKGSKLKKHLLTHSKESGVNVEKPSEVTPEIH
ncbi:uncharacterized protein [Pseudorasbora parva]|uniref:uncharacterized protein n=1 Tax=Pseudorasbora parva TaxID=51549 RepID=UPI00351F50EA